MANLPIPVPRTFTVGETESGAYLNSLRDDMNFLVNVPICNAVQATAQSVSSGNWVTLTLDSTVVDTYGGHSNTVNNSEYIGQVSGWYLAFAAACFASNATGWRGVRVIHNGNPIAGGAVEVNTNSTGATTISSPPVIVYMAVGDYVQGQGYQTSGVTINTSTNQDADCSLTVVWLHS